MSEVKPYFLPSPKFDEFVRFRDRHGLNQLDPGQTSQNGALFTMEYLIWLINDETVSSEIKLAEFERLREVYRSLEVFPGVSVRSPGSNEFDSMDNAIAFMTFSVLFDFGLYSKRSLEHGRKTRAVGIDETQGLDKTKKYYWLARLVSLGRQPRFFWNNNTPNLFCFNGWHGRSPSFVPLLKMTSGKWVGPWGCFFVWVGQFIGLLSNKGNADARKLPYVLWQYLKQRSRFWEWSYRLWCWILLKQYPRGMLDVYDIYYKNPEHPIKKYSKVVV